MIPEEQREFCEDVAAVMRAAIEKALAPILERLDALEARRIQPLAAEAITAAWAGGGEP
ncbi:hypothetical protein [Inquilinus limosus]|uniref:hypothetical protein n=1 Tax=Inquilinus limosus TaxID=171674 RepID=UPI000426445A|nr:hypothetical protein [Inquilinus limosus]